MRTKQILVLLLVSILCLNCTSDKGFTGKSHSSVLLQNAHVFDAVSGKMSSPRDVLIVGEKVTAIKRAGSRMDATEKIDCSDKFIIPGLFDSHTHLGFLKPLGEDMMRKELAGFVHHGVLYVRDVGSPIDVISEMSRMIKNGEMTGPEIFYTGPMLESSPLHWEQHNEQLPGFTVAVNNEEDVDDLLPALAEQGAVMIKTFFNIRLPLYQYLIEAAHRQDLKVVHDPGAPLFNWIPIDKAIELGITSIEHAKAPWPYVLNDELKAKHDAVTGPDGDPKEQGRIMHLVAEAGVKGISEERLEDLSEQMIKNDVFLCPTLYIFKIWEGEESEVTDQNEKEARIDEQTLLRKKMTVAMKDVSIHFVRKLTGYGVKMLVGQDNIKSEATLEEMKLMRESGVSAVEILKGATIYPAQWLDIDDKLGSVEPGKVADLVVLDADPLENIANVGEIFMVIQRGVIVDE